MCQSPSRLAVTLTWTLKALQFLTPVTISRAVHYYSEGGFVQTAKSDL